MKRRVTVIVVLAALVAAHAAVASAQGRRTRSITGSVTSGAVTRALGVVPEPGVSEVSLALRVGFNLNSADLTAGAMRDLDAVAAGLNDASLGASRLLLEGHTDATGDASYNQRLSERRASAVLSYLVARGVARERLASVGYGEFRPLAEYPPNDSRQRRVEIVRQF